MLVELSLAEEKALEELSKKKDMSINAVIRQALRLYQLTSINHEQGLELAWTRKGKIVHISGPKKFQQENFSSDESKG